MKRVLWWLVLVAADVFLTGVTYSVVLRGAGITYTTRLVIDFIHILLLVIVLPAAVLVLLGQCVLPLRISTWRPGDVLWILLLAITFWYFSLNAEMVLLNTFLNFDQRPIIWALYRLSELLLLFAAAAAAVWVVVRACRRTPRNDPPPLR